MPLREDLDALKNLALPCLDRGRCRYMGGL
jgi:hypothetical protein